MIFEKPDSIYIVARHHWQPIPLPPTLVIPPNRGALHGHAPDQNACQGKDRAREGKGNRRRILATQTARTRPVSASGRPSNQRLIRSRRGCPRGGTGHQESL